MGLEKLIKYIPDQERRINQLINRAGRSVDFEDPDDEKLEVQKVEVKRGSETPFRHDPHHPTGCGVTIPNVWGSDSSRIFVRSEHKEVKPAALVATKSDIEAFLVGGQSWIGPPLSFPIPTCGT